MKHYDVDAAVIVHEGKYLCMQKGETKYPYTSFKFEFPGDKIEKGETPQEALHRELLEELDLDVIIGEAITKIEYEYPDFDITLEAFLCFSESYEYKLNEHIDARWLERKGMETLDWSKADQLIIKELWK